jgi:hypothetical protein
VIDALARLKPNHEFDMVTGWRTEEKPLELYCMQTEETLIVT